MGVGGGAGLAYGEVGDGVIGEGDVELCADVEFLVDAGLEEGLGLGEGMHRGYFSGCTCGGHRGGYEN